MPQKTVQLLTDAVAANGVPTLISDGQPLNDLSQGAKFADSYAFILQSTAGSVVMTVTIKLWVWSNIAAAWAPFGANATAADKGLLNAGNAIDETQADLINHSEVLEGLQHFDRIYAEITVIGGTATAVSAWVTARS